MWKNLNIIWEVLICLNELILLNYNNIFASFIDKMKKSFYNSDKIHEIDKNLINSVRKEVTPKVLMTVVVILVDVTWLLLDIYMLMIFN